MTTELIFLGWRINTDTGCAGCRRVEERFNVKNTHTHTNTERRIYWKVPTKSSESRHFLLCPLGFCCLRKSALKSIRRGVFCNALVIHSIQLVVGGVIVVMWYCCQILSRNQPSKGCRGHGGREGDSLLCTEHILLSLSCCCVIASSPWQQQSNPWPQ